MGSNRLILSRTHHGRATANKEIILFNSLATRLSITNQRAIIN